MAQAAYEFECSRAELLGLEKPNFEEFCKDYEARRAAEEEQGDTERLQDTERHNESYNNISGGLEELSSILRNTQRHINNLKISCNSITNFLKVKIGRKNSTGSTGSAHSERLGSVDCVPNENTENDRVSDEIESTEDVKTQEFVNRGFEDDKEAVENIQRKSDLTKALGGHIDKLDNLIEKAENCQYSLRHQNKQLKAFMRK